MDYVISSDPSWVDIDVVWRFLSEESYWARGIPRETVLKSLPHSFFLVFTKSARRQAENRWDLHGQSAIGRHSPTWPTFSFWRIIAIRDCPNVCCKLSWLIRNFGVCGAGCFLRQMHTRSTNNLVSRARRILNGSWRYDGRMSLISNQ